MRKKRGKRERRATVHKSNRGVSFQSIFPSGTAGRKFKGHDLPPSTLDEGNESRFRYCKQCGFLLDTEETAVGDEWGGNQSSGMARPTDAKALAAKIGGDTTSGATDETIAAGTMWGQRVVVSKSTTVRWLSVYGTPAASGNMIGAIYNSNGILLSMTEEREDIPAAEDWLHFKVANPVDVTKGDVLTIAIQAEQSVDAAYTSGSVLSAQYSGTYLEYVDEDFHARGQLYGPPARISAWTMGTRNYSIYVSDYLHTLTNTAVATNDSFQKASDKVGYKSGVSGGCPFCGASNWGSRE